MIPEPLWEYGGWWWVFGHRFFSGGWFWQHDPECPLCEWDRSYAELAISGCGATW